MKKKVYIVGSGGLGRELYSWLACPESEYDPVGFVSDDLSSLDDFDYPISIVQTIENFQPVDSVSLIMGIMNPKGKQKVFEQLLLKGASFSTFVHPSSIIGHNVKLGTGVVICPMCILTCDITLEDGVFFNTSSTMGHDGRVGKYSSINGKVEIGGGADIGSSVLVGSRALVLPQRKISDSAVIGAGSVVVGHVKSDITVFGNPARKI
ncbi:NeuD/PglB/VioB family sugar acetyltransferase [Vibrio amylolyticus]|uniref:NeuD/PglB/VioB family sugar acetyltransferase n=1 Tax=Vibrio amylolyticus TaxID=2847292 RepID=UPI003553BA22